jgi:hypothetical protein
MMGIRKTAGIAVALALLGCVHLGSVESNVETSAAYTDDRSGPIPMVSTMVGVRNVFIPSTVVVSEGSGRSLTIFNTTDIPHGFTIPGLGVETILQPGEETVVALPALEGGHIYDIGCQLHAPHRHATLVVVHARK